jgi:predicted CopG family antitoxin
MPLKGWKTLTIRDDVYSKLEKKAKSEHRSVTNMAEAIILEATK